MTVRRFAVLIAASAALALSACAGTSPVPSAGSAPSATAPTPATPTTEPSGKTPVEKGSTTISGTVSAGVEPGCLILQSTESHHVLVFDDPALRAEAKVGATITVTGKAKPAQMTTCQQGVPFIVTAVRAK
jgi:hypothetical protein